MTTWMKNSYQRICQRQSKSCKSSSSFRSRFQNNKSRSSDNLLRKLACGIIRSGLKDKVFHQKKKMTKIKKRKLTINPVASFRLSRSATMMMMIHPKAYNFKATKSPNRKISFISTATSPAISTEVPSTITLPVRKQKEAFADKNTN